MHGSKASPVGYEETISHSGHRLTPQRREVYNVLLDDRDHPTASEVFARVKQRIPGISLATVYNCLETLVECGLARQMNVEREATRYCHDPSEHGHFLCDKCGRVSDIPLTKAEPLASFFKVSPGFVVTRSEIILRGTCDACNNSHQ
jgi:Fur family peroxide stress response transcriptional regulator